MIVLTPPTPLASQRWSYADGVDIAVKGGERWRREGGIYLRGGKKAGIEEEVKEVKLIQSMAYQTWQHLW